MGPTISLEEAIAHVLRRAGTPLPPEPVPLHLALDRHLAADVRASTDWPVTDRSAMDGFGVIAGAEGLDSGASFDVVGESLAGSPWVGSLRRGQAIRIMTGAVVPEGVDAVVPVESTTGYDRQPMVLHAPVRRGDHVRTRGSELRAGARVLAAGARLRAAEIGVLAALGHAEVDVRRRPVVAVLATGDEVVPVEQEPEPHQVRDSNAHALAAQVEESGAVALRLGIARDERPGLLAALRRGLDEADVLLTIGGVSKGTHDLVHGCLRELGVEEVFHGIALKPGKPTFFGVGRGGRGRVLGLPGNPASCFVVFDLLVRPLLACLRGTDPGQAVVRTRARRGGADFRRNRRTQAIPARLEVGADGVVASLQPASPSGDPFALAAGDAHAIVPADAAPGAVDELDVRPYGGGLLAP